METTRILGIDIGSTKICAVMAECECRGVGLESQLKIIGLESVKSQGLKKGSITNIELASNSIRSAVNSVMRTAGTKYDTIVVSISGKDAYNTDCRDVINIPEKEVNIKIIERAISSAQLKVTIPHNYEILHILPYNFKIDEQDNIEDPLGMNGSRLEVEAHIIAVQKSALLNLRKAIEKAGLKADNVVLSGYASSISTLNPDEKALGAVVIDMGGSSCNMVVHSGNSIRYNEFLGVGSSNVTIDLSTVLHTPPAIAESIKIKYGTIKNQSNELITIPDLGDENASHEISMSLITSVISIRVEETLMILAKMIDESNYKELASTGVILTGGMTKLDGLKELASVVFNGMAVRIARPKDFDGMIDIYKDPANSCALGLCMYGAGHFTPYEIDSEKKMRYKDEVIIKKDNYASIKNINLDNDEEAKFHSAVGGGILRENGSDGLDLKIDDRNSINKNGVGGMGIFEKILNYFRNLF